MNGLRLAACAAVFLTTAAPPQTAADPDVRAAVERFFKTQEAEDVEAYLAQWSREAPRLRDAAQLRRQLRFVFDAGDDRYSDIVVERATADAQRIRVRVSVQRERTSTRADGTT